MLRIKHAWLIAVWWAMFSATGHAEALASIEDASYPGVEAARMAWRPMGGTEPVGITNLQSRPALRMPCVFAGREVERASWDHPVKLDLGAAAGVRLSLWCANSDPISHFSIYFKSGPGWYHAGFYPEASGEWSDLTIDKTTTTMEGNPTGWGQIESIRISAWCGISANTEFFLGGITEVGRLGLDTPVAVLRADSGSASGEGTSAADYAERMCSELRRLGIASVVLSDLDATPERLATAKLVVLPYNPTMPDQVGQNLLGYLKDGGKLMVFYIVPPVLRDALGVAGGRHIKAPTPGAFARVRFEPGSIPGAPEAVEQQSWNINEYETLPGKAHVVAQWQDAAGKPSGHAALIASSNAVIMTHILLPGDAARKDRMLFALTGYLLPEVWSEASRSALEHSGALSRYRTFEETTNGILSLASTEPAKTAVAAAAVAREAARAAIRQGQHALAIDQARASARHLQEAFCLAQKGEPGEFRAFWCHSAFGVQGIDWEEAVKRLATNGFTAVLPNMLWGGVAFYPSEVLPVAAAVSTRGDQIEACLKAAKRHGLQVHVWKVNFNLGSAAPPDFLEKMRRANRLQSNLEGKEEPWLCPSHPENQRLEVASLVELVRKYPVDGIHFDYIRYPDSSHCFCAGCRERFGARNPNLKHWPQDVLAGGPLRGEWLDWRRENITSVVRETSAQARQARPGVKLSAAVFRNWTTDRDSVGQDWKIWCQQRYLDFVCPMDYTDNNRVFENMVRQQVEWAGPVPCYPGIGVSASASSFGVDKVIDQILITRKYRSGGFVIFNYGVPESGVLTPQLGMGITRTQ